MADIFGNNIFVSVKGSSMITNEIKLVLEDGNFYVGQSPLHGEGLFSKKLLKTGEELGPSLIHKSLASEFQGYLGDQCHPDLKWDFVQTSATRYINHSYSPNAKLIQNDSHKKIYSIKIIQEILPHEEITLDYTNTFLWTENAADPEVIKLYSMILEKSPEQLHQMKKIYEIT